MLSPEQIEEAGERVAAVYREIEARMLDHMARAMAEGLGASQATVTAAALLAQSQGEELRRMLDGHGPMVDAAVRDVVEEMLEASDADDAARCGGSPEWPRQVDATIAGISEVLARDNIQMVEGAKQAFLGASIEAVTRVNAGAATREQAVHRAVRRLERDGIDVVTYQDAETGRVTVRNKADVAVRRHVRTQIAQDGARLTMERMERLGVDLVEVSSHSDSRPEHAAWQGRCYSLRGERTIDGTVYPDLAQATGYGTVTGLMGANCRHSFGPYRHGAPRAYEPDPRHPSGLTGAEVYELEQGQRYRERKIREAKRELRGAQVLYERDKSAANLDAVNKAGQKLRNRQEKMRAYIDGANAKSKTGKPVLHRKPDREWAGDMPISKMPASANRTLPQLLGTPSAKRAIAGLDKKAVTAAVGEEMARRGGTVAHFRSLSPGEQQGVLRGAIASVRVKMDGTAKASSGAHAAVPKRYIQDLEAKGLQPSHAQGIAQRVAACSNADARRAFERALPELGFDSIAGDPRDAHYNVTTRRLTLDMATTASGFSARPDKAPYQTFFHEAGHYIDHLLGNFEFEVVKAGRYRIPNMSGAAYQAGMADVVKREVRNMLEEIKKRDGCTMDDARRTLTMELRAIPAANTGGLPDIIHGATAGKSGWGHRLKYWRESKDPGLATETFAHFYETTMANPAALETLKKHLPETYNLFISIIGG